MKKNGKLIGLLVIIFIIYTIGITSYFLFFKTKEAFVINGKAIIKITVGMEFIDPGFKVYGNKEDKDIVLINNNINKEKLGNYEVIYTYKGKTYKRVVQVIDDIAPSILLIGNDKASNCKGKDYVEEGFTAKDNYDKDLTDKVKITRNGNIITYKVSDSSGNIDIKNRILVVEDKTPPVINLLGGEEISVYKESIFNDKYTAIDNCDDDITDKVKVTSEVDYKKIGTYKITYTVKDQAGNETEKVRTIKVIDNKGKAINDKNKTIYLTFDDGPNEDVTPKILDILKHYNIKATFFINDKGSKLDYIIKKAFDEGHVIANHSASHNYKLIYSSDEAFFKDMDKMEEKILSITGISNKIMRFPGGVSNTVSFNYNKGIMSRLHTKTKENGYIYFDWNVSSGDTGTQNSTKICNNIKRQLGNGINIVLMHDSMPGSMQALTCIIDYGIQNNYKFDVITRNTPVIHHGIAN